MTSNDGSLTVGMRVKVARRGGATGVVDQFLTDNRATPPKPVAGIDFDGAGYGFDYVTDCEPVPFAEQPAAWQRAAREES